MTVPTQPKWERLLQLANAKSAEYSIEGAMYFVESSGAHPLLTDAIILLGEAQSKVEEYLKLQKDE